MTLIIFIIIIIIIIIITIFCFLKKVQVIQKKVCLQANTKSKWEIHLV